MRIAVAGAGYVGLVTAAGLARLGHHVTVAERDTQRRAIIAEGRAPFFEPGLDDVLRAEQANGRLVLVETASEAAARSEMSFIAVGTPDKDGAIDLSQVRHAATEIGAAMRVTRAAHVVVVKSTVVPGTTSDVVGPLLERASGRARDGFGLAMNPEFLREGTSLSDFMAPDRIVIGADDAMAAAALKRLYAPFDCPILVTNARTAEMTKYANNALLATLVSFSNELAGFAETMGGIDFGAVLAGVHADRRLSPRDGEKPGMLSYLKPSAGFGGSCLPKDVAALRAAGRAIGADMSVLDGVTAANAARAARIVDLLRARIALKGARVAILGAAFKAGTDDLRHAASIRVAEALISAGAAVTAHDPMCGEAAIAAVMPRGVVVARETAQAVTGASAAIVMTAEPNYRDADWAALANTMRTPVLLDIWNICAGAEGACERLRLGHAPLPAPEKRAHVAG